MNVDGIQDMVARAHMFNNHPELGCMSVSFTSDNRRFCGGLSGSSLFHDGDC